MSSFLNLLYVIDIFIFDQSGGLSILLIYYFQLVLTSFLKKNFTLCFCFLFLVIFIYFGCPESSLLWWASEFQQSGATLRCDAWASHCSGPSCCGTQALGTGALVVVARGL